MGDMIPTRSVDMSFYDDSLAEVLCGMDGYMVSDNAAVSQMDYINVVPVPIADNGQTDRCLTNSAEDFTLLYLGQTNVTQEQEEFGRGFEEKLNELRRKDAEGKVGNVGINFSPKFCSIRDSRETSSSNALNPSNNVVNVDTMAPLGAVNDISSVQSVPYFVNSNGDIINYDSSISLVAIDNLHPVAETIASGQFQLSTNGQSTPGSSDRTKYFRNVIPAGGKRSGNGRAGNERLDDTNSPLDRSHNSSESDTTTVELNSLDLSFQSSPAPSTVSSTSQQLVPECDGARIRRPKRPASMALTAEEQQKIEEKRKKNRDAAKKCRSRKMSHAKDLEMKVKLLSDENAGLAETAKKLREYLGQLKDEVHKHRINGCEL